MKPATIGRPAKATTHQTRFMLLSSQKPAAGGVLTLKRDPRAAANFGFNSSRCCRSASSRLFSALHTGYYITRVPQKASSLTNVTTSLNHTTE